MKVVARSEIGNYRTNNEDSFAYKKLDDCAVFAVADGIGGEVGGEIASKMAVELIVDYVSDTFANKMADCSEAEIKSKLASFYQQINREILIKAINDSSLIGMGTTLTVAIIFDKKIYIGHIGDTRAYLVHGSSITQLTKDHTNSVNEEAIGHSRNQLTKSLGVNEFLEPDFYCYNVIYGDLLLMCSDGIHGVLQNQEILACVKKHNDLDGGIDNLINKAIENDSKDNITALITHVRPMNKG